MVERGTFTFVISCSDFKHGIEYKKCGEGEKIVIVSALTRSPFNNGVLIHFFFACFKVSGNKLRVIFPSGLTVRSDGRLERCLKTS